MAATKRGAKARSLKSAKSRETMKEFTLSLECSDEDDAPEEVTFQDSKAAALATVKQALDTAKREKEQLKEKRRKRQELFQEQKKRKLLSDEVLEEMASAPSAERKESDDKDYDDKETTRKHQKPGKKKLKKGHVRRLGQNCTVKTVQQSTKATFQLQAAEDFIRSRLYGAGCCRTTTNELLSLQNKTRGNHAAAVQFVKKDWAHKQKAKAEKLKKRWIHKRQNPDS